MLKDVNLFVIQDPLNFPILQSINLYLPFHFLLNT